MKLETSRKWFRRKVQKGEQLGKKIGFPTLNFRVGNFGSHHDDGVYACEVKIHGKTYTGALYFGPRLSTNKQCLEVYVLELNKKLYNQTVQFRIGKKIRKPMNFSDPLKLKKQIEKDLASLKKD